MIKTKKTYRREKKESDGKIARLTSQLNEARDEITTLTTEFNKKSLSSAPYCINP
jgi:hypothetical protein